MAITRARHDEGTETEVVERYRTGATAAMVGRFVAVVVTGLFTLAGLIALAKFDWDQGFDAPPESFAGVTFTPWIAIGVLLLGLFALAAAASWDRESKLFMGALLVAVGIAVLVAEPTVQEVVLSSRLGWMTIITGAVLAIVGLLASQTWASRRVSRTEAPLA